MLGAAPWALLAFILSLPFALLVSTLYKPSDQLFVMLAWVNVIALARMTYAWHMVVILGDAEGTASSAPGRLGEAQHLVLLAAITVPVAILGRITGDVPYIVYSVMDAPTDMVFAETLLAVLALIWLPVLYALSVLGLSLPRSAVTGAYGFRGNRAAMPYRRWPLILTLLVLVSVAGETYGLSYSLKHYYTGVGLAQVIVGTVLCALVTFVVTAMYAVAYRDSAVVAAK